MLKHEQNSPEHKLKLARKCKYMLVLVPMVMLGGWWKCMEGFSENIEIIKGEMKKILSDSESLHKIRKIKPIFSQTQTPCRVVNLLCWNYNNQKENIVVCGVECV